MSEHDYDEFDCGMCGETLVGDGVWCGNEECALGPDESTADESEITQPSSSVEQPE